MKTYCNPILTLIWLFILMNSFFNPVYSQSTYALPLSENLTMDNRFDSLDYAQDFQPKSPKKAQRRALLHALVPSGLGYLLMSQSYSSSNDALFNIGAVIGSYGYLIGPSMGNLYSGDNARGITGIAIRSVVMFGPYLLLKDSGDWNKFYDGIGDELLLLLGTTSFYYNIFTSKKSAREYNRRHAIDITLSPTVDPGSMTPVLSLKLKF